MWLLLPARHHDSGISLSCLPCFPASLLMSRPVGVSHGLSGCRFQPRAGCRCCWCYCCYSRSRQAHRVAWYSTRLTMCTNGQSSRLGWSTRGGYRTMGRFFYEQVRRFTLCVCALAALPAPPSIPRHHQASRHTATGILLQCACFFGRPSITSLNGGSSGRALATLSAPSQAHDRDDKHSL